jgi:hypothetical protein
VALLTLTPLQLTGEGHPSAAKAVNESSSIGTPEGVPLPKSAAGQSQSPAQKNAQAQPVRDFDMESRHGTSIPLRDMPTVDVAPPYPHREHEPLKRPLPANMKASAVTAEPDRVAQYAPRPLGANPTVGVNFMGLGICAGGVATCGSPSDSEGNVGLTQYVEFINTAFAVFDKKTGALLAGPTAGSSLFNALGGDCATTDDGDPIVQYDKAAKRWILSQFSVANASTTHPSSECIAVSKTSDATGSYNLYQFTYSNFDDYPKMGVWSDKWLINYNMFGLTTTPGQPSNTYVGDEMCALDRANMLAGNPANQACTLANPGVNCNVSACEFTLLPSDLDGATPPAAGNHGFFIDLAPTNTNTLDMFSVTSVNFGGGSLMVSGPKVITIPSFTYPCGFLNTGNTVCVPQNDGGAQQVDTIGDRMMYRLAYRNFGSYDVAFASHTVDAGVGTGQTAVRWYEIRNMSGTPSVFQSGTYAPDSSYRWVPSIAMDKSGNIAVGYSLGSSSLNPSIAISTRAPGDAPGTLGNETVIPTAGPGAQQGISRWGDYTAMTVDPVDDCTMWYIDQFMPSTGVNWGTEIADFLMAGCGVSKLPITSAPSSAQAGVPFSITVKAEGSSGQTVPGYRGTVHFTSSDTSAMLPADYTFTAADAGAHTFSVVLVSLNSQTITVADANSSIITPGQATILVGPGPTARFTVSNLNPAPPETAGTAFNFTVTAVDQFGNTATGYAGTVHFSSSDPQAVLPGNSTLVNGVASFGGNLKTAGNRTLIVTDTVSSSITGSANVNVIAAAASQFALVVPATAKQGTPFNFSLTAKDPFGNVATSYRGTVAFTSSDGSAAKPANYTFGAGDNGIHVFSATLNTLGGQTLTATDSVNSSITNTSGVITVGTSDPALHAVPRTIRIFRATPPVIVGSFTDDDTAESGSSLSATINWGDGSPVDSGASVTIVHVGGLPNLFNVLGSHTYANKRRFTVTVTVTDSAGGSIPITSTAQFGPRTFSF